ncbi:Hypothetical protein HVPorG_03400 [Roseomonas mucosa]|uniref:Uncharacterized protein n=2 Tax=Roseomonas mucosa TaxID=207340 RepID=A0A1S8D1J5_9PROT|nr:MULTISPECIES: hypothetical protein [Roseomonas]MBS5903238.1 hypothetical protein [Acetobacteraceae bacterium]MDT8266114.1 hypothetical protein [Roseomonas sp. DSM 102946]ATR22772.1 hypothetical protein CTJ15_22310 [Roseomonas sp. FDAARGOS_362]AWV24197.1 Hypothetical protein RADP37_03400 [Roseomonas mucosa]MCG7354310.1 hypothetical protein [Roseomonas mucosa]
MAVPIGFAPGEWELLAGVLRMPFDGAGFRMREEPPERSKGQERFWAAIVLITAVLLLVLPVSAQGFIDIVHYVRGH